MAITAEQKAKYLNNSNACPFCGSDNISAEESEFGNDQTWQTVVCLDCRKAWRDIYQ